MSMEVNGGVATLKKKVEALVAEHPILRTVATDVEQAGGRAFLVGGVVRSLLIDDAVVDIDVEIFGLPMAQVEEILKKYGHVEYVGVSFGVFRLAGYHIDWSLPRKDESGRKPRVEVNPHLPLKEALLRRDLTMNAMALDLKTYELHDPFGGVRDIAARCLRTPDASFFVQDPLRFFRVMQFIGRFEMEPDAELNALCKAINLEDIATERVAAEYEKLLMKSRSPSRGLRWLAEIGRLTELLPELGATQGVPQDPGWHPEGDVFEHTMQALDAAVQGEYPDNETKRTIVYAALCHDLGKVTTTRLVNGRLRSFGHSEAGVPFAKQLLKRMVLGDQYTKAVLLLVEHHMKPGLFPAQHASARAYKRLASALAPHASLRMLAWVAEADGKGRNPARLVPLKTGSKDVARFKEQAAQFGVLDMPEAPLLTGKDFLESVPAGPRIGKLVKRAYEVQIEEGISDKAALLKRVIGEEL